MVFSRRLLRQSGLLLRLLGLDGRDDLSNTCKAFHALELLLAVQQHRPQPPMEHPAASYADQGHLRRTLLMQTSIVPPSTEEELLDLPKLLTSFREIRQRIPGVLKVHNLIEEGRRV